MPRTKLPARGLGRRVACLGGLAARGAAGVLQQVLLQVLGCGEGTLGRRLYVQAAVGDLALAPVRVAVDPGLEVCELLGRLVESLLELFVRTAFCQLEGAFELEVRHWRRGNFNLLHAGCDLGYDVEDLAGGGVCHF